MDRNSIDQQLERRLENLDNKMARESGRRPLTEYDRDSFREKIYYEDAILDVIVVTCKERVNGVFRGVRVEGFGPWIVFRILDILDGDCNAKLSPGDVAMARWDNSRRIYKKYIYKEDPQPYDLEVLAMSTFMKVSEGDIVGK